ncbi:MAG TPA: hypothetical protein VM782_16605 [Stellaceae bacterium]|nr:hypothetical protein [Stellaceae bacterium]
MIAATSRRVERNTAECINEARQAEIDDRLRYYAANRDRISMRLKELDREWDIERAIEANAASVALTGFGLAALVDRKFIAIPFAVAGFLLQHALQGWCPPVAVLRRLGFRTAAEIYRDRCALEAMIERPLLSAPRGNGYQAEELHEGVEAH